MNKSSVKKNNILYILACTAIFIFLIVILFYDKATDTRQQRSVHAVSLDRPQDDISYEKDCDLRRGHSRSFYR